MKKSLSLLLVSLLLVCVVSGCGKTATTQTTAETQAPAAAATAAPATETAAQTEAAAQTETAAPAETAAAEETVHRNVVSVGVANEPNSYHPYNATSTAGDNIFDFIYDRLVFTNADGSFEPRLADSWESNEDNTVITFHLNENATWQDGEPFTAEDMVFTAQVATHPDSIVTRRSYFAGLEGTDDSGMCEDMSKLGVIAVDDHTLEYHFKQPIAVSTFLYIDAQRYYPMPKHLLENVPMNQMETNEYWQHPIGTGPFKFESAVSGERIEVTAYEDYFLGKPNVDKIIFRIIPSANVAAALMSGEIDLSINPVPAADVALMEGVEGINTISTNTYNYNYMTLNFERDFFNSDIAKAFSMAINRQMIVEQALYGEGQIAVHSLSPLNPYFNQNIAGDPYDPEGARALLEKAGWDFNREITFVSYTANPAREAATYIIQQNLADIGVKVNIQMVDWSTLIEMAREGESDLSILGGSGSLDPDDSRVLMQPDGAQNFCNFTDPRYYELAVAGRAETDQDKKEEIYKEYQQLLHDEPTYVWLYHANNVIGYDDVFEYVPVEDFINLDYKGYKWTFTK